MHQNDKKNMISLNIFVKNQSASSAQCQLSMTPDVNSVIPQKL